MIYRICFLNVNHALINIILNKIIELPRNETTLFPSYSIYIYILVVNSHVALASRHLLQY